MFISVAVGAELKPDLVNRAAFRNVTLRAAQQRVLALQWIARCCMFFQSERGWFESFQGMACRAFGSAASMGELASVGIMPMTVGALLKCQRFFEVPVGVALHTVDRDVLTEQRKFRSRMFKRTIQLRDQDLVPPGCGVARLARLRKCAPVRISMAITADAKCDSGVARLSIAS